LWSKKQYAVFDYPKKIIFFYPYFLRAMPTLNYKEKRIFFLSFLLYSKKDILIKKLLPGIKINVQNIF
jgi:hypothetical protein